MQFSIYRFKNNCCMLTMMKVKVFKDTEDALESLKEKTWRVLTFVTYFKRLQ